MKRNLLTVIQTILVIVECIEIMTKEKSTIYEMELQSQISCNPINGPSLDNLHIRSVPRDMFVTRFNSLVLVSNLLQLVGSAFIKKKHVVQISGQHLCGCSELVLKPHVHHTFHYKIL